jgi:hypothetical protein
MEKLLMAWSLAWLFVAAWVISGYAADGYALRRKYNQLVKENNETNELLDRYINYIGDEFQAAEERGEI